MIVLQYTEIAKSRGKLYACENQLYIQHSIEKGVRYLKCINEDCTATAKVIDSRLHAVRPHNQHDDQNAEIERLQVGLLERCRKRAASSSTDTLRAIFNEETRAASLSVSDITLQFLILADSSSSLAFSVPCKFRILPKPNTFLLLAFPC